MRHFRTAMTALLAVLVPGAALADTLTTSGPFSLQVNGTFPGSVEIGSSFDRSLGTVTGETITFSGTFTPGYQAWAGTDLAGPSPGTYPASVPMTIIGGLGISGPQTSLTPEIVNLVRADTGAPPGEGEPYVYTAIGTPEPFTVSTSEPFLIFPPYFSAGEQKTFDGYVTLDGGRDPQDLEVIQGTLTTTITYTPALPEPASLALLGFGVLGIGLVRRRG